ncbi:MAG: hypothetical protein CMC76_08010 [Flavobacteriaceae bacterium]|nr:hypothetical protein [Flavobacteriaceae bacterium]
MIKFFRNIRKKLLNEGKTTQYFKYAIGEIVLVVIGILMALQINNWNDNRKTRNYEKEILSLINQNLQKDSLALSIELDKAKEGILLTDRVLKEVAKGNYTDSLYFWMGKIITFERFKSQSSAFEILKARGIETISDKTLQLALISYYDDNLFKVYQSLDDVEQSFKKDWQPILKNDFLDFRWSEYCEPNNPKEFFENPSTITFFKIYQDNRKGIVRNTQLAIDKISEIRIIT